MYIKELMLGDWVRYKQSNEYFKINSMAMRNLCWDEDNRMPEYNIEPIPLTEEILEASGYRNAKRDTDGVICAALYKHNEAFVWYHYDKNYVRITNYGDNFQWYTQVSCRYVHELQHALRLCGLNSLADNFKIE